MNRFFLELGPVTIHYYGVIIALAILTAYFLARKQAWRFGLSTNEVDKYIFWLIIISIIGARIYFLLFNWSYYSQNLNETWQLWHGGISIFGAIISGGIFAYLFARKKAYSFWQLLDLTALVLPLGQAIGRWGNFINYEAFGKPTTLPWKMFVPADYRPVQYQSQEYFHPAFLYESLADLILFAVLFIFRKKLKHGQIILVYLLGYSIIRFFMEFIRVDVLWVGGVNGNQAIAVLLFLVAGAGLIWKMRTKMV